MDFDEYQALALKTEKTPSYIRDEFSLGHIEKQALERLNHAMLGLCTEVGEAQDALKKALIYGRKLDEVNLIEEAGDILWYLALFADALGYKFSVVPEMNIAKCRKRFGDTFTQEKANVRDLEGERSTLEGKA